MSWRALLLILALAGSSSNPPGWTPADPPAGPGSMAPSLAVSGQDVLAVEAADLMEEARITTVLVVDEHGVLTGAINSNDLMRAKVI